VQYDLSEHNRWNMLSMPLGQAYPGDFTFGGYPLTWVRTFEAVEENGKTIGKWVTRSGGNSAPNPSTRPFSYGDGFVLWLDEDVLPAPKGLKQLPGKIREFPFFEHHAYTVESSVRRYYESVIQTHYYYPQNTPPQSRFYNFSKYGDEYFIIGESYTVPRSVEQATKLYDSSLPVTPEFAGGFALIGNPYMAVLDFNELYNANQGVLENKYYIWKDAGTGTGAGSYDVYSSGIGDLNGLIAPLQGFIVAGKADNPDTSPSLQFNESWAKVNKNIKLRSSASKENQLKIVASNPVMETAAYIAKREGGQDEFGNMDARKIMNGISNVPEIYTLKPSKGSPVAVAINIIGNDEQLIPVCLSTSYEGDITLTFSGMDSYKANLTLIDLADNTEIDLTGLTSYDYEVNYTPKEVKGEPVACDDRFFIRISKTVTGLNDITAEKVIVYESNGLIQVVSNALNPIKEVAVYDLQVVLLHKANAINAISHTINRNRVTGVYVVRVITEKGFDNVKIVTSNK
jgi:hypothetical protein